MQIREVITEFHFDCQVRKLSSKTIALYYSEQPTFDADGFVVDPVTLTNMKEMAQEVAAANVTPVIEAIPVEDKVA